MATLAEMVSRAQELLNDVNGGTFGTPTDGRRWTVAQIQRYLLQGAKELVEHVGLVATTMTFTTATDTALYSLATVHSGYRRLKRLEDSSGAEARIISYTDLDGITTAWRNETGNPQYGIVDMDTADKLRLYPCPNASYTMAVTLEVVPMVTGDIVSAVPVRYTDEALPSRAASLALWGSRDAEDRMQAREYKAQFEEEIGRGAMSKLSEQTVNIPYRDF